MKKIYKYKLPIQDTVAIELPIGAQILKVDNQNEELVLWALVDTKKGKLLTSFCIYGTGHPIDPEADNLVYVGTAQFEGGALVWHVFKVI